MIMTIIGVKRKKGEYQGKSYDNFFINVLISDSGDSSVIAGGDIAEFKIRSDYFFSALGRNLATLNNPDIKDETNIVGLWFSPAYSKYQGVTTDFTLAVPEKKK